jgi:hypothetical protein
MKHFKSVLEVSRRLHVAEPLSMVYCVICLSNINRMKRGGENHG